MARSLLYCMISIQLLILLTGAIGFRFNRYLSGKYQTKLRAGKPVTVTFEPSGKSVVAEQGANLAQVAAKAGVFIPYKCKQGRCNSCELRLNGRVSARACQTALIPGGPTKTLSVVVVNKAPL